MLNFICCTKLGRGFGLFLLFVLIGTVCDQVAAAAFGGAMLGTITTVAS